MKKYLQEFRAFAVKGNVVDLAVAVIIGGAFGKIVSSLVADVVMPVIGAIFGGVNFTSWKWILKAEVLDAEGAVAKQAVTLNIGNFVQNIFDFLVIAFAIFMMVKVIANVKNKLVKEKEKEEAVVEQTTDQKLLTEIRDILKNRQDRS
ncbi:MAG: large-conductance mechanosensitive channel protein MscL [Patescibacteria group bacterium]|jgi:large conductance mechanosensitive channel|nr:large-conductance mechanosensitive channel protein MscL [bacterium]HQC50003.1 large-conductance mechanosensitive channel protein MscL [bacterium]